MDAQQYVKLTGTNRSSDLIALVAKARRRRSAAGDRNVSFLIAVTDYRSRETQKPSFASPAVEPPPIRDPLRSPIAGRRSLDPFFAGLVALARRSDPIPSRTRPSNALAPMVLCLKTWESRSSPGLQRTEKLPLSSSEWRMSFKFAARPSPAAGWSSPVARQAHNLKAAGSNPAPATNTETLRPIAQGFSYAIDAGPANRASPFVALPPAQASPHFSQRHGGALAV